jgi:glycosyltransferase involved in cell wall biosynthesis
MKFHDYRACGTPMVCCDVGEAGRLGRTLPGVRLCASNVQAWSDQVRLAVEEVATGRSTPREEILRSAREQSWEAVAGRLEEIYRAGLDVLAARHGRN